ncbi:MAG: MFS transporter [Sporomusaceae bacterium]|nr:MFS transporter [Sporomusaceae bacterium]
MSQLSLFHTNRQFQTVALSQMLTVFGSNLLLPVLPIYFKLQGFSDSKIGALMGIAALGALVVRPWCGRLVDIRGSRPVLQLGQALTAMGIAAYFFTLSFAPLLLLRFFQGVAMAFFGTASVTFASSVETGDRVAGAIALYTVFTMVGLGIATSGAPLLYSQIGFSSLVAAGLTAVLAAAAVMGLRGRAIAPPPGQHKVPFLSVLRAKEVLAPTVCLFASNFACMTMFTFVPLLALARSVAFSGFFIAFMLAVVATRLSINQLTAHATTVSLATGASLVNAVGVALVCGYLSPLTLAIAGACIGIGFGLIFPVLTVYVVQHGDPLTKGTALSIFTCAGDVGNALGASVLGVVADLFGYQALFAVSATVVLACTWHFYSALSDRSVKAA